MARRLWSDSDKALAVKLYEEFATSKEAAVEFRKLTGMPCTADQIRGAVRRTQEQIENPFGCMRDVLEKVYAEDAPHVTSSTTLRQPYAPEVLPPAPRAEGVSCEAIRTAILTDVHVPYEDKAAVACALGVLADYKPHRVVLGGDFLETESLTRHAPSSVNVARFQEECMAGNLLLDRMQDAVPTAHWYFCEGNHENRVSKWVKEVKELAGSLDVAEALYLKAPGYHRATPVLRGMTWVPLRDQPLDLGGGLGFAHGMNESSRHAYKHALVEGPKRGIRYWASGHMHSFQQDTSEAGFHAYSVGWLGDESQSVFQAYTRGRGRPWQTGIALIESLGDLHTFTPVHIRQGRALYGGKVYGGEA
jgi:hypothetical protein